MGSLLDFLGRNTALERTYVTFTSPASLPPPPAEGGNFSVEHTVQIFILYIVTTKSYLSTLLFHSPMTCICRFRVLVARN